MIKKLTRKLLLEGVEELSIRDSDFAEVVNKFGPPPLWARQAGFASLVKIILEQQVSLASAEALYKRLESELGEISPPNLQSLSANGLRKLGFTRQKAEYCEKLAMSIISGDLNLSQIARMSDEEAFQSLVQIKGVGPWTANVYIMMALRRQDIWPDGDLALAESARRVKGLRQRPSYERLNVMARKWAPWRSVAARILWHSYLSESGKTSPA